MTEHFFGERNPDIPRDNPDEWQRTREATVARTYPHFPFPPHRDTREDITLEVFLLYRPAAAAAVIVRKWVFEGIPSRDVAVELRAGLEYAPDSQRAVVPVTGLPEPFREVIDLSSRMR